MTLFLLSLSINIQFRDRIYNALNKLERFQDVNLTYHELVRTLSLPVNRLEKYASILKEYHHHLEVRRTNDDFLYSIRRV